MRDPRLEELAEDDPQDREVDERLGERPEVPEYRPRVLQLELGARENADDAQPVRELRTERRAPPAG